MSRDEAVTEEVRALERLGLEALRDEWRRRYGAPPKLRSPELLRFMIAWRIQAAHFGGLDAATRRRLRRRRAQSGGDALGDGARIVREWRGVQYQVDCVAGGFRLGDVTYPSLSAAAHAITGVKRNGPKFFGLREEAAAA